MAAQTAIYGDIGREALFGSWIALEGDSLLVGAPKKVFPLWIRPYDPAGGVFVFEREEGSWRLRTQLTSSSSKTDYGSVIAVAADLALVAAPSRGHFSKEIGRVYVYRRIGDDWEWEAELGSPMPSVDIGFGRALAIDSQSRILVGAHLHPNGSLNAAGRVLIYTRQGLVWDQTESWLAPPAFGDNAYFGHALATDGNHVFVGSPGASGSAGPYAGAVVVYENTVPGSLQHIWTPGETCPGCAFGFSLAARDSKVLVGAPNANGDNTRAAGAAFLYEAEGVAPIAKLVAGNEQTAASFGYSVAFGSNSILIGAPLERDSSAVATGAAYRFNADTPSAAAARITLPGFRNGRFGYRVLGDGQNFLVAAPLQDTVLNDLEGTVHVISGDSELRISQQLHPGSGRGFDRSASALAGSAEWLAVGQPGDDLSGFRDAGSVALFRLGAGQADFERWLPSPNGWDRGGFGSALDIHDETLAVGAPRRLRVSGSGGVAIFEREYGRWALVSILDPEPDTRDFGKAISLPSPDMLVVGSSDNSQVVGKAFIYTREGKNWNLIQTLSGESGDFVDFFGASLASTTDTLVVGAPHTRVGTNQGVGSAHVFRWNNDQWSRTQVLVPSNPGASMPAFGSAIALDNQSLYIGAPSQGFGRGAVYVYTAASREWVEQSVLNGHQPSERFGDAVAAQGARLIVGAPSFEGSLNRGRAYLFDRSAATPNFLTEVGNPCGEGGDEFGRVVSATAIGLAVGAPSDDAGPTRDEGATFVIDSGQQLRRLAIPGRDRVWSSEDSGEIQLQCDRID